MKDDEVVLLQEPAVVKSTLLLLYPRRSGLEMSLEGCTLRLVGEVAVRPYGWP